MVVKDNFMSLQLYESKDKKKRKKKIRMSERNQPSHKKLPLPFSLQILRCHLPQTLTQPTNQQYHGYMPILRFKAKNKKEMFESKWPILHTMNPVIFCKKTKGMLR
jgi:hypothetical protein